MRKIRNAISLIFVAVILLYGAAVVSAEENEIDWESYDWESYDWENFSPADLKSGEWKSMCKWLRSEADLKLVFYVSTKIDGAYAETMGIVLYGRFTSDPVGLIAALSLEEETVQTRVIRSIIYAGAYVPAQFEQLLSSLTLPENASAGAKSILVQMIRCAEEDWGMEITNPQTGDPISLAVLLMAVSGLSGAVLLKRRTLPI